ncbi:MAG: hypothetical protein IJZ51_09875 [Ruminiclostridium sp.]|nr:hypothetical protein [Ruminiclostridium sp.]
MDKNIFNEAIPTAEQKARLKQHIFDTQIKIEDNEMKKVTPFKTAAAVAAAFVLVVGAVVLIGIVANMGGTGIDVSYSPHNSGNDSHVASNGGVDDPESVVIGTTDLKAKYPQYFDLDASKGFVIYTWFTLKDEDVCVLVSGKNIGYTDDEILNMPTVTVSQMKEILKSYNLSSDKISVAFFEPPYLATTEYDPEAFVKKVRKELGLDGEATDLKAKYPQYFDLDTSKGLLVYAWITPQHEYLCGLTNYKSSDHTIAEITALPGLTTQQMREVLESYNIKAPESVSVRYFDNPSLPFEIDLNIEGFENNIRKELGIEFISDVQMEVNFKNETEFDVTFLHSKDNCNHVGEFQVDPEYSIWLDYEGELISYYDYALRAGIEIDNGPLVWETVLHILRDDEKFVMEENLSETYGKLPAGKYYLKKEIFYKTVNSDRLTEIRYVPFEIKGKPEIAENQKDQLIYIVNDFPLRLGDGSYIDDNGFILGFDFAIVYDTPHNFYHDTFTENGGDIPLIFPTDENTVYKAIEVGDKLSSYFTVTEASFNCNVIKGAGNIIENLDPKMSENRVRAEGNATVTAYAYKQKYDNGTSEVMIIIDPTKDMNKDFAFSRLFRERLYDFRYVSESGGLFEAISSTPVMKLSQVDSESFDRDGLWEVELDITAINMVYTERGGQSYVSPEISDLRFIQQIEVSEPVAE